MEPIFLEITTIIVIAAFFSIIFKFLKQPPILAYVLTGILIGPLALFNIHDKETLEVFGQFGITFLLFMLGLEMKISELKSLGKVALITGFGQILFTSIIGYGLCILFGFSLIASLFISIALTFSSTIIVVKLLSDKKDLNSLYGKISIGFLLVQDFAAILALMFLSGMSSADGGSVTPLGFLLTLLKGVFAFAVIAGLSKTLVPKILKHISHNQEILFLFSLAWVLGVSAFIASPFIGFSIEIGGFIAGISLATSIQHFQIQGRIRALRDFFITIFFITLGMGMVFENIAQVMIPAIAMSVFVLIGNPIIVMIILGLLGYKKRTSFLAGLTVAQISEFSLIVIFMGNRLGHVSDEGVAVITLVGVITFTVSTYMILNGNKLYAVTKKYLSVFERKRHSEDLSMLTVDMSDHTILIGGNRMGEHIIEALQKKNEPFVAVDFNPEIVEKIKNEGVDVIFGDISDPEIQEYSHLSTAKLIISTVPDLHDNLTLLKVLKKHNKKASTIFTAVDRDDANELYEYGADYVVIPHFSGGLHISEIIEDGKTDKLHILKEKSLKYL